MRILMTGMAARGIGSTHTRYDITSLPDAIARGLRDLGHEVDGPRRVRFDEDVSGYDAAWVQIGWISSLSSSYAAEAGRVMADMGPKVVRYVDDWRSQWLADDIYGHAFIEKGWQKHTHNFRKDIYAKLDDITTDRIRREITRPITDPDALLVVPLLAWGDKAKFDVSTRAKLKSPIIALDPQNLCDYVETNWASDDMRARQWVVASLQDWDKWVNKQGLTWPVLRLGGVKKNPGGTVIKGLKQQVIPEREVLQIYAQNWGVLSPAYDSAGSGYWRTRYDQAMGAGALLWAGPEDATAMGGVFLESTPTHVEGLSTQALAELQAAQAERLDSFKWPVEQALQLLDDVSSEAASRG